MNMRKLVMRHEDYCEIKYNPKGLMAAKLNQEIGDILVVPIEVSFSKYLPIGQAMLFFGGGMYKIDLNPHA